MPDIFNCDVISNEILCESVHAITVSCKSLAGIAHAGQFVSIKCGDERLLRRPISICRKDNDNLAFAFEVKGEGTRWLSLRKPGESLDVLGMLGNGFTMPEGNIIVVGGGIGTPPLLFAAQSSMGNVTAILGFRDNSKIILLNEFESLCKSVYITTDDGSSGIHGTVALPLMELLDKGGYIAVLACGPRAMLKAVADICKQYNTSCQVSLEERMACGVGACVVCTCATLRDGAMSMSRICKDGPVFDADEVLW